MKKPKKNQLIWSLLLITIYPVLSYLLLIPFLGFYNDDWLFAYIGHFYGQQGLITAFIGDRPFLGYLFTLNHNLIGENLFLWHFYMFLMRLVGGYALFFLLRKIWPNKLSIITSITILFLIYPGFLQQTGPLGYQNYITALTVWITSLLLSVLAIKKNKVSFALLTIAALILQLLSFLMLEFFIGMEILRLLLIFHFLKVEINFIKLKERILYWGPYILGLIVFLLWRFFIFKATRQATDINWIAQTYYSNPIWVASIPFKIIYSWISGVSAYLIPFIIRLSELPTKISLIILSLGVISSFLLYPYYKAFNKQEPNNHSFGRFLLIVGSASVMIALIPIIVSGRFASVILSNNNYDRYTISSIVGITFIYVGLLLWKTSDKIFRGAVITLVAISVVTQIANGYWHSKYWDNQKETWWQIYWRAPQIEKDTLLIFDFSKTVPLYQTFRIEDYQIWAPGNLFFNYHNLPSHHFGGQYLENDSTLKKLKNNVIENVTEENGAVTFTKNFRNTILISLPTEKSCLWILDKDRLELPDHSSELLKSNTPYSNIDRLIQKDIVPPPSQIFGTEPSKNWCYYFQKASLARQMKDWKELSNLREEMEKKNLEPKDVNEWLPFIEGLIISEKYQQVDTLIKQIIQQNPNQIVFKENICKMARRLQEVELEDYCTK